MPLYTRLDAIGDRVRSVLVLRRGGGVAGSGRLLAAAAIAALVPEFAVAADGGPSPSTYLIEVLDLVEQQAYYADRVDWMQWRVDAADEAASAQRTADTYDFVQRLLLELGDHHSGFFPPPSKNGESVPTMPFTRPSGAVDADAIGRLTLPGFSSDTALAAEYVGAAEDVLAADACGWIVDLRGNPGGNLFPMLAALAPLLGPGPLLGYRHRDGTTESIRPRRQRSGDRPRRLRARRPAREESHPLHRWPADRRGPRSRHRQLW